MCVALVSNAALIRGSQTFILISLTLVPFETVILRCSPCCFICLSRREYLEFLRDALSGLHFATAFSLGLMNCITISAVVQFVFLLSASQLMNIAYPERRLLF